MGPVPRRRDAQIIEPLGLHSSQHCWPSSPEILISAIEKALAAMARKQFRYTSLLQEGYIRLLALEVGSGDNLYLSRTCLSVCGTKSWGRGRYEISASRGYMSSSNVLRSILMRS